MTYTTTHDLFYSREYDRYGRGVEIPDAPEFLAAVIHELADGSGCELVIRYELRVRSEPAQGLDPPECTEERVLVDAWLQYGDGERQPFCAAMCEQLWDWFEGELEEWERKQ